jgi:hypothetical protein
MPTANLLGKMFVLFLLVKVSSGIMDELQFCFCIMLFWAGFCDQPDHVVSAFMAHCTTTRLCGFGTQINISVESSLIQGTKWMLSYWSGASSLIQGRYGCSATGAEQAPLSRDDMDAQLLERSKLPYPGTIWMLSYWSGASSLIQGRYVCSASRAEQAPLSRDDMDDQLLEPSKLPYPGMIWMLSYWSGASSLIQSP